jgi:hypothetical protein
MRCARCRRAWRANSARKGLHVAHVVIDGAIDTAFIKNNFPERYKLKDRDGILSPEAIADSYWMLHQQPRNAWTHETRPAAVDGALVTSWARPPGPSRWGLQRHITARR